MATNPLLFTPLKLRRLTLKNRVVISLMCQYSADDGMANDWHFAHLAKFATGGAGIIFIEATAMERNGLITHGDVGIWSQGHVSPLQRITAFLKAHGAVPAIQLAHAGRKASMQRPWHGNGPLDGTDRARGEDVWPIVAPSALPLDAGWLVPHELRLSEIAQIKEYWRAATVRARDAGFDVVEVHGAHGYLLHEFLSPLSNKRTDKYGGGRSGRMRLPLEVAEIVRENWPSDLRVFNRVSSTDGLDGGWGIEDTVALAKELKARGIDVMDCSSGGLAGSATAARVKRTLGFQVPFVERVRKEAGMQTMAVGLTLDPEQADAVLQAGQADLIAIGRCCLIRAGRCMRKSRSEQITISPLGGCNTAGWWLDKRQRSLAPADAQRALRSGA